MKAQLVFCIIVVLVFFVFDHILAHPIIFTTSVQRKERSFFMVKPDGVQRGLIGDIIHRFEKRGYKMVAGKLITPNETQINQHYEQLMDMPFFPGIIKLFTNGQVFPMVWEGNDVVAQGRMMLGDSDPRKGQPGTIRGDYSVDISRDVCHASDSVEEANREISIWFEPHEVLNYTLCISEYLYEL